MIVSNDGLVMWVCAPSPGEVNLGVMEWDISNLGGPILSTTMVIDFALVEVESHLVS